MKTIYYDMDDVGPGAVGVFMTDAIVKVAGTTMNVAPISEKDSPDVAEYAQKDVHFIFEDDVPELLFYSVPRLDVFARTTGGLLAALDDIADIDSPATIVLVDNQMNVWRAADSLRDMLTSTNWKDGVRPMKHIDLYPDKKTAMENHEFIEVPKMA